ncbi:aminotransferase class I/II-fold pyridoxal phosphate-dependent enzyme [Acidovorax sp. PRC11]|uniref:aminotransferase class I/II-fold pyridoxal phosphate-dependent enzyme n=1 Tax=Acidovorax sp. PRC11 TaxID=2962592 RepID=UPI002881D685|nr:aminotransferase class I/II-fold pyridoxal phosphate-dependent enzyme [Acidovorax sp. PRC11]MDT0137974.1 aminotransferase class I/II-fold pyridoxal phosphate-dependent enzyme [Acidovorax sp. PRC11]
MTGSPHGGPDALGVPLHDFSTNANACGPCPIALAAVRAADASRYPDPDYTALREALGAWHGVAPDCIVPAASASEFIHRITAWAVRQRAAGVVLPAHAYGDYAQAAAAWGLPVLPVLPASAVFPEAPPPWVLHWACEPSSPLGTSDPALETWRAEEASGSGADRALRVVDCAYAPLRLAPAGAGRHGPALPVNAWQLWTPNKALGLTGVRGAYAIAPEHARPADIAALRSLAPSWPVGAHGVAMLAAWVDPAVQDWLAGSLATLRGWKAHLREACEAMAWAVHPGSQANYLVARPPVAHLAQRLRDLRAQGIKLRDCASFGLPGRVRLGVLPPASVAALQSAWKA